MGVLYGKPMARNSQFWTHDFCAMLDGPRAYERDLIATAKRVADGGLFGYRFYYPPMRVGRHGVFWHRPLVAFLCEARPSLPAVLDDAPRYRLPDRLPLADKPGPSIQYRSNFGHRLALIAEAAAPGKRRRISFATTMPVTIAPRSICARFSKPAI